MEGDNSNDRYRECLRNHAASLGSYATDGCGEFTPSGTSPAALDCAACGCHRNFHRRVTYTVAGSRDSDMIPEMIDYGDGGVGGRNQRSPELERIGSRKRFRTKFTADQKEKMMEFAERIGWKMQRRDQDGGGDDEIQRFCRGVGVSRQVFKVWMHNHKNNKHNNNNNSTTSSPSSSSMNNSSSTTNANVCSLTH